MREQLEQVRRFGEEEEDIDDEPGQQLSGGWESAQQHCFLGPAALQRTTASMPVLLCKHTSRAVAHACLVPSKASLSTLINTDSSLGTKCHAPVQFPGLLSLLCAPCSFVCCHKQCSASLFMLCSLSTASEIVPLSPLMDSSKRQKSSDEQADPLDWLAADITPAATSKAEAQGAAAEPADDKLPLKFKTQDQREVTVRVNPSEPLQAALDKFRELVQQQGWGRVTKFMSPDGDKLTGNETAEELELEQDDIIEVSNSSYMQQKHSQL